MKLQLVLQTLQQLAPLETAESWDNVGLILGESQTEVTSAMTCLTLTPDVAEEAIREAVQLVITHHPLLFKPVQQLNSHTAEGRMILGMLRQGIAVYSPHTAWDNSAGGINQQLAEVLGLQNIRPLRAGMGAEQVKIVTFVPESNRIAVQHAVWEAGAGVIGQYRQCSYFGSGQGTFFGTETTNPAVGQAGQLEFVAEDRLEFQCPAKLLAVVLQRLRTAHPYEEPAIDVYPLRALGNRDQGAGRQGALPAPMRLKDLNRLVCERLQTNLTPFVGDPQREVTQLGIACGAAAEFASDAQRAGCQALLTGEARFHACLEARTSGLGLILPGHYATERLGMERLAELLKEHHPELRVFASHIERDPLCWDD